MTYYQPQRAAGTHAYIVCTLYMYENRPTRAVWICSESFLVEHKGSFVVLLVVGNACFTNQSWNILWWLEEEELHTDYISTLYIHDEWKFPWLQRAIIIYTDLDVKSESHSVPVPGFIRLLLEGSCVYTCPWLQHGICAAFTLSVACTWGAVVHIP